jgi:GH24 family phage-related lysozyme (muramidase)
MGTPAKENDVDELVSRINGAVNAAAPKIMGWESFVPKAYWDDIGKVWTVGHGLTRIPDAATGKPRAVREGDSISEEKSRQLVLKMIRENAVKMNKNYPWFKRLGQNTMSAALDTAYNAGWGVFSKSNSPKLNRKMSTPGADPDSVYWGEHDTYASSGGKRHKGLVNRRIAARKAWGPAAGYAKANTGGIVAPVAAK